MTQIHTKAMLAKLSISTWSARKYDKKVSEEVSTQHGAVNDAGRFNKHLLGGKAAGEWHAAVIAAAGAARIKHYEQTLPWADEGWRILTTANWSHYTEEIRKVTSAFDVAAHSFVQEYPNLRDQARIHLNGLWKAEDYPEPTRIAGLFSCSIDFAPIPAKGDLRISLPQAQVEDIERQVEERVQAAAVAAMKDAWDRLRGVVGKVHERLASPDAVFRDSLIGNVREMVDILQRLNLTDDPNLEAFRVRVEQEIASLHPELLREIPSERDRAAQAAQDILTAMAGMYGTTP